MLMESTRIVGNDLLPTFDFNNHLVRRRQVTLFCLNTVTVLSLAYRPTCPATSCFLFLNTHTHTHTHCHTKLLNNLQINTKGTIKRLHPQ
jgi:hypothetical protein